MEFKSCFRIYIKNRYNFKQTFKTCIAIIFRFIFLNLLFTYAKKIPQFFMVISLSYPRINYSRTKFININGHTGNFSFFYLFILLNFSL